MNIFDGNKVKAQRKHSAAGRVITLANVCARYASM